MDPRFELARIRGGGLIRSVDLRDLGVHPEAVQRAVRSGALVRVRTGAYALGEEWRALNSDDRHRWLTIATATAARRPVVVSHLSAAALHRLPIIGRWPEQVSIAESGRAGGRRTAHVAARRCADPPPLELIDAVTCTSLARTLVDVAASEPLHRSVPMLDAALRREPGLSKEVLRSELEASGRERGRATAQRAVDFADARAGSAGESLSRVRIHELGFAAPELQVRFDDILGSFAVADFYWRGIRLIGEFDGSMKYTRSHQVSGADVGTVVLREKRREDALRRRGEGMARWDWATALAPRELHALLTEFGVPRR